MVTGVDPASEGAWVSEAAGIVGAMMLQAKDATKSAVIAVKNMRFEANLFWFISYHTLLSERTAEFYVGELMNYIRQGAARTRFSKFSITRT